MNLNVQTDRTLIRATSQSTRYFLLSFTAPEPRQATSRAPVNIVLVIDRSGSMGGKKIELARRAVVQALQMLRSTDRFSVICYDHEVEVVVPSTLAASEAVRNAIAQVQGLQARGNTDLGGGWLKGCEQIAQQMEPEQVGCCLLLSDGLANHGITDRAVARLFLANAQAEALELNREGQYEEAQERLRKVGRRIASYAGSDPELLAIISELDERGVVYSRAMSSAARKQDHFASMNAAYMRSPEGKAKRRPTP